VPRRLRRFVGDVDGSIDDLEKAFTQYCVKR
jgi:hypothetical protein